MDPSLDPDKLVNLDDPFYTAEQIVVPPELPEILKQFTKAAIKTQPPDLLEWAASYFRARAVGAHLPVKDRMELIPDEYDDLTLGLLKIMHRELGHKKVVTLSEIEERWVGLGLSPGKFTDLTDFGQFPLTIEWHRFVAVACAKLAKEMEEIFRLFCQTLTKEPEGNNALVPVGAFMDAYTYLAQVVKDVDDDTQDRFLSYIKSTGEKQNGFIHPGNLTYRDAPPMQIKGVTSRKAPKKENKEDRKAPEGPRPFTPETTLTDYTSA